MRRRARLMWVGLVAVALVVMSLAGCGASGKSSGTAAKGKVSAADQAAARRGYISIGFPCPVTGVLASDTSTAAKWAVDRAVEAVNKDGGIYIKSLGKKLPIKVTVLDTQSDTAKTAQVATELITKDHVDMLMAIPTPIAVNPVTGIAERYHVPFVGLIDPIDAWLTTGTHPKWSFDAFFSNKTAAEAAIDMIQKYPGISNKVVGLFLPNDSDGVARATVFKKELPAKGYTVVDPGRFPDSTNDFSSMISKFKKANVQIVVGTAVLPTFATFWRQAHEEGFVPKIVAMGKALNLARDMPSLGDDLAQGLTSEVYWYPTDQYKSSISGETATDLATAWTKETGQEFDQGVGWFYAAVEICADAIKTAQSVDPQKTVAALSTGTFETVIGPIKFNSQHYDLTPVAMGQWLKGGPGSRWPWIMQVVSNQLAPGIPKTAKLVPVPSHP